MGPLLQRPIGRCLTAGVALVVALACSRSTASGRMTFRTYQEVPVGTGPTVMAPLDLGGPALAVGSDDGLVVCRVEQGKLVPNERIKSVSFVKSLDAGDVTGDKQADLACVSGRSAAVTILPGAPNGSFGEPFNVALEAPPTTVKVRPFNSKGDRAIFVVQDGKVLVLVPSSGRSFRKLVVPDARSAVDVDVADLDGNELPDLLVGEVDRLLLLHGNGDGTFGAPSTLDARYGTRHVLVTDLDRDGRPDVLVIGEEGLLVYRVNKPAGGDVDAPESVPMAEPRSLLSSSDISAVSVADIDGNGYPDIAFTDAGRGTVSLLMGGADGHIESGESYVTGRGPEQILLGDFTGDGRIDAVVLNHVGDSVVLLPGTGSGFRSSSALLADARDLSAIAVGDFDGDGHLDIAAVSEESGTVILFAGNGRGSFTTHVPVRVGNQPQGAIAGRFRPGDSDDLAVTDFGADEVVVLEGSAQDPFGAVQRVRVGEGPSAIVGGAFNLAGRTDLAVGSQISKTVSILRNDGNGRFAVAEDIPVETEPGFLILGDTNGDGRLDLLVGNDRSDTVIVLLGTPGGFAPAKQDHLGDRARPLVAEDLDGDGRVDLVMADEGADVIEILPGTAGKAFGSRVRVPAGPRPHSVAAGDFDEDGLPDLAVLHQSGRIVSILLNTGGPTAESQRPKP
jgi:hypothetical protein